jgi:hypothetical protein
LVRLSEGSQAADEALVALRRLENFPEIPVHLQFDHELLAIRERDCQTWTRFSGDRQNSSWHSGE